MVEKVGLGGLELVNEQFVVFSFVILLVLASRGNVGFVVGILLNGLGSNLALDVLSQNV